MTALADMTKSEFRKYRRELYNVSSEAKAEIEKALLDHIIEAYKGYFRDVQFRHDNRLERAKEPVLTTTYLLGYLNQHTAVRHIDWFCRERKRVVVMGALLHLKKQGKLATSLGIGDSGREARCWEPAHLTECM